MSQYRLESKLCCYLCPATWLSTKGETRDGADDVLLNQSLAAQRRGAASLGAFSETQVGVVRAKSGLVAELRGHHDRDEHAWQFDA